MKKRIMTTAMAILVLALTGCGSSSSSDSGNYATAPEEYKSAYDNDMEAFAAADEYYDGFEEYEEYDYSDYPAEEAPKMAAEGAEPSMDDVSVTEADAESARAKSMERMLIKNVYLRVESEDVEVMVKLYGIDPDLVDIYDFEFGPQDSGVIGLAGDPYFYDGLVQGLRIYGIDLGEATFTVSLEFDGAVYSVSIPVTVTLGEHGRSLDGNYGEENKPGGGINGGNTVIVGGEL